MKPSVNAYYGWRPDKPDARDRVYRPKLGFYRLARQIDLRPGMPPVYDQGQLGSCTANAIAAAFQFEKKRQGGRNFMPSRLFIYYNERVMEGSVNEDAGAEIRDGIKSIADQGVCYESSWPYKIEKFARKPTKRCYTSGVKHQALTYERISSNISDMRACLASGFPFVFGFTVYESLESQEAADTGVIHMPVAGEAVMGGHAVLACGYIDATRQFIVRNSWGENWGQKGYMLMPYDYVSNSNLADDRWKITLVE